MHVSCILLWPSESDSSNGTSPVAGLKRLAFSLISLSFRACLARLLESSAKLQTGFLIHVQQPSLKRDVTEKWTLIGSQWKPSVSPLPIGRRTCEATLPSCARVSRLSVDESQV